MKIIIKTKNLELTSSLTAYIEKRIIGLKKFINILKDDSPVIEGGKTLAEVFVEVEKETKHHRKGEVFRAEAELFLPGKKIVAQAKGDDLGKAVTEVRDELEREIKEYKLKTIESPRRAQRKMKEKGELG